MTQPYWNPQKVNEIVQKGMPTCDNSRYPIQEFFEVDRSNQHHHYAHRLLGQNRPYFHFPWYWDLDPVHYYRPVVKGRSENFIGQFDGGFGNTDWMQWIMLAFLAWSLFRHFNMI